MFTRRFSNALLISLIVHLIVLLAFAQQGTIGGIGEGKGRRAEGERKEEKKEKEKVVEVEFGKRFMIREPVAEAVERYALKKLAIAAPVERPVAEALTRAETIEFVPEAIAEAPATALPRGVITTTRPPTFGGGGGLPIAKFVQSMSYVPPTTTAIQYKGPGMVLALARPGMDIRVPAGLPVTRGVSPGIGPGRIPGVGGFGPGLVGRGVGLPSARIARFAPAKVGGEGISIGGLAGEISEAEEFGLSEEPGAIIIGRGKDIKGYFHAVRVRYSFGDFYTDPTALPLWLEWVSRHTKIKAKIVHASLRLSDKDIMKCPFLWISGHQTFSFAEEERRGLRNYLFGGGFIFIDDCEHYFGSPFDVAMRRELVLALGSQLYNSMYKIPPNRQDLLNAYYSFDVPPPGDDVLNVSQGRPMGIIPWVEGLDIDGRLALIYSNKDLGCAMESKQFSAQGENPAVYKFMTNVLIYVLTHSPLTNLQNYIQE
jgi:hypothetical protein